ncbi:hypothetical protein NECAME_08303 [Necator americanus]|uniref:Uncharacterized protein n=1 Tax=Necator americanus TaxID=51031 RepID=W2TIU9_NECAM|nr:hypothetical protein NECAME_08303 [Necator americanus]ETN81718.1 hypothetical protein NECAME_08303 [Necator americanus]
MIKFPNLTYVNENVDRDVKEHDCADFAMNEEQENSNGPLIFDFLSLSKLEERCNAGSDSLFGKECEAALHALLLRFDSALEGRSKAMALYKIMACVLDSGATMIWPSSSESTHNAVLEAVRLLVIQYRVQSNEPEHTAHKMRYEFHTTLWISLIPRDYQDMIQAYIAAGFMTNESDLDLKPQLDAVPEERARALLPLHLALQTMLEIKRHLTLPAHMLTAMTRSVISKYCSSPITDVTKVFYETAVPLIHVQPDLLQKNV